MAMVTKYFGVAIVLVVPIILLVLGLVYHKKCKKQEKSLQNRFKTLGFVKEKTKNLKVSARPPKELKNLKSEVE